MNDASRRPHRPGTRACWLRAIDAATWSDRPRLRRLLERAGRTSPDPRGRLEAATLLREFRARRLASSALVAQRARWQPNLALPPELPLAAWRDALLEKLEAHQVTIVCGATGSGKSTQLPKLCMALGRGLKGRIGLTQPRRLAARAIASRLASETGTVVGQGVGFQTRFEQSLGPATRVKVMTDGILLQEIHHDRQLLAYDTLIIDEVHERSVNVDLLLGYLRNLLARRPELKLVLTSATIEAERFQAFFPGAGLLEVPGRNHAIEIRYRPPEEGEEGDLNQTLLRVIGELDGDARGDILVFLPGEREIMEAREALRAAQLPGTDILPLYARLGSSEQQKIFAPHRQRHVVLATNVAETSLTVPGVCHVIDSGLVRISSYSPRSKLQRLPIVPNSRASADQRKGRCGRERAGICVRLYSEEDFNARPAHTEPELQRSNLAGVILRLSDLALPALDQFPLLDPPSPRAINDGYTLLRELGALDEHLRITSLGRQLSRLPLDPRLARIVIAAGANGSLREALIITAGLSAGDIREWPREGRAQAAEAHAASADRKSEFRWLLSTWEALAAGFAEKSRRQQASFCRERFWSWRRAREWQSIHAQLREAANKLGLKPNTEPAEYRPVHEALLAGFALRIGRREEGQKFLGCRNLRFRLHPACSLREKPPRWLVAAEITETTAAHARLAAAIEPSWVVAAVPALVKRSHSAAAYDPERGRVMVREEQSLQGLVLAADVLVDFATLNPAEAREVFIREALVEARLGAMPTFLAHNLRLLDEVAGWEARTRRMDLRADATELARFYQRQLPPQINSRRGLLRWLEGDRQRIRRLEMGWEDATRDQLGPLQKHLFPTVLELAGCTLPLAYAFAPDTPEDGVTATIPLAALPGLAPVDFERLVPGLLRDKVLALMKALPKAQRRLVSPMNEFATAITSALESEPGPLAEALARVVLRMTGAQLPAAEWRMDELPLHLRMRFVLVDEQGTTLATGRDLAALQHDHAAAMAAAFRNARWTLAGQSKGGWCFGELPERALTRIEGVSLEGFPALLGEAQSVSVVVLPNAEEARLTHRRGVARLLLLSATSETKALRREIGAQTRMALAAPLFGWREAIADWLIETGFAELLDAAPALPRDEDAFRRLLDQLRGPVTPRVRSLAADFVELFERAASLAARLDRASERLPVAARQDLRAQLDELLGPQGLAVANQDLRRHCLRYLRAMDIRLDRLQREPAKDARKFDQIQPSLAAGVALPATTDAAVRLRLRHLQQELRVATFAPELRTSEPVSVARLQQFLVAAGNP